MKISRNSQEEANIHIKGKKLEEVNQYKYLGSILDSEKVQKMSEQELAWVNRHSSEDANYSARTLIYL